jgi:hypothetical protein
MLALVAPALMAQRLPLGPMLPSWAVQQVGSYPGYTGRDAQRSRNGRPTLGSPAGWRQRAE